MMKYLLAFFIILASVIFIPNAFAQETTNVPNWIKNNAGWWADGLIDDSAFLQGIQYLIKEGIMVIPPTETTDTSQSDQQVPAWVKNTAGWWADDQISEAEFVNAIQYLIKGSIIQIPNQNDSLNSCKFEHIPALNKLDNEARMEICLSKEIPYLKESLVEKENVEQSINSFGFREPEFSKEKPESTIRIFLVGGSTIFNGGEPIEFTTAGYLQKKINNLNLDYNVEVINAGVGSAWSKTETKMIKEKLFDLQPDIIFVYDGWNDLGEHFDGVSNEKTWSKRWQETCEQAKERGVKMIVTLQALLGFGDRLLTDQEYKNYFTSQAPKFQQYYPLYIEQLNELSNHCTDTADLTKIFDNVNKPIIHDNGHTLRTGNEIISENILKLITPSLSELTNSEINIESDIEIGKSSSQLQNIDSKNVFVGASLDGMDFSNQDLSNTSFFGANLEGANFSNSNLSNSDFRLANLQNTNFHNAVIDNISLERAKLNGSDFSNVDFTNTDLEYVNLANVNLSESELHHMDLKYTVLMQADLSHANVSNSDLSSTNCSTDCFIAYLIDTDIRYTDFTESSLIGVDFGKVKDKNLEGTILFNATLSYATLEGVDISGRDLTFTNLSVANLRGVDFSDNVMISGTNFLQADLTNANFEGVNLAPKNWCGWNACHQAIQSYSLSNKAYLLDLLGQPLSKSDLRTELVRELFGQYHVPITTIIDTEVHGNDLLITYFHNNNFDNAILENANFANSDMQHTFFIDANLSNADLSGADLTGAVFMDTDLSGANLAGANLADAILDGTVLNCKNHAMCYE